MSKGIQSLPKGSGIAKVKPPRSCSSHEHGFVLLTSTVFPPHSL